jgi:hypothetical protein
MILYEFIYNIFSGGRGGKYHGDHRLPPEKIYLKSIKILPVILKI